MQIKRVVTRLRKEGFRITKTRKAIIQIFCRNKKPLSAVDLVIFLKRYKMKPDKATIYRELKFLLKNGIIREVNLGNGRLHFEWSYLPHHHHLTCKKCRKIVSFFNPAVESCLNYLAAKYRKSLRFRVDRHILEFVGICVKCRQ